MNREIFTPEEMLENNRKKLDLMELMKSKRALLFAGAGCSVDLGYPDWNSLIDELEKLTDGGFRKDPAKKSKEPLVYVDAIKENIATSNGGNLDKYHKKLVDLYAPRETGKLFEDMHTTLIELDFKGIITTNYDEAFEAAYASKKLRCGDITIKSDTKKHISCFFLSLDFPYPKSILHLHGFHNAPKEIILSEEDYKKAYGDGKDPKDWTLHRKVLWALLATRRIIFVGFSFKDPFLSTILQIVGNDLWRGESPVHYAIMPISFDIKEDVMIKAENLKDQYGIETVFYHNQDGSHTGLRNLLREVAIALRVCKKDRLGKGITNARPSLKQIFHNTVSRFMILRWPKKESFGWVEKVNKKMTR